MQEHAVPQNITTFEFKLFGPFTIRQFIYVAAGGIVGAIFYFSPLPKGISYIIGGIFVLGGIGFAAIPLQGRPLDKWIIAFFRSITHPTQRIWIKDNHIPYFLETNFLRPLAVSPISTASSGTRRLNRADLATLLARQQTPSSNNPFDQKESRFLSQITSLAASVAPTAPKIQGPNSAAMPFNIPNAFETHATPIQAAPPAQLRAREEEIKAQEFALLQKQKALEEQKIKLEKEKQQKLEALSRQLKDKDELPIQKRPEITHISSTNITSEHTPEIASQPFGPQHDTKVIPFTPTSAPQSPKINNAALTQNQKRLSELDEILSAQQKIEAEIKQKEEEIARQQTRIKKEQDKFTQAWGEFKRNKAISEGQNTSTPDSLQPYMLANLGKKTTISPLPSSNFSALSGTQTVAAQIASDINFGGNVIAIQTGGNQMQFLQGIGDTRIRKLRTPLPDFSKAMLPILGERQFDISGELKKRFAPKKEDAPLPQPETKTVRPAITIEPIKKINDFQPIKAGPISARDQKSFIAPPSPNLQTKEEKEAENKPEPSKNTNEAQTQSQTQTPAQNTVLKPFNYQTKSALSPQHADVKINFSEHPNTPNGVIYDPNGNLVENALISVFDKDNKPVRAFKTNGLGQFISVTPLPDGHYTIQTEFDGLSFDTIAFEAKGNLLEPFAIRAK